MVKLRAVTVGGIAGRSSLGGVDDVSLADGAKRVMGVENGWHDLVFGRPAERVALGSGFAPPSAEMIGVIAAKVGLSGDNAFKDVRRLLPYTAIARGGAGGAVSLAKACLSSLAHDLLAGLMASALREAIRDALEPVRSEVRPIPTWARGPAGRRARQLHSDLVAAEPRQRTLKLEMRERQADEPQAGGARRAGGPGVAARDAGARGG